jgi:amino acid transporter
MTLNDLLFGKPLRSSDEAGEKLGPIGGLSVFGLDALSSAAYGPEAALTLLIPLAAAGIAYMLPITASIIILLAIVYFSYRQTIAAYPGGGGSYTVARQNLGDRSGVLAAAALMIDYVLTAAVGISAGVGALVSAVPSLESHTLPICLVILLLITLVNLRGARETGAVFIIPTYLFLGSLLVTIVLGVFKTLSSGGHPLPVVAPPALHPQTAAISTWLLLKAFSSGCTAMTGVEAVSNGVKAFREPVVKTAQRALTAIIALLIVLLAGIAFLMRAYRIGATDPGAAGYQSVLSQLTAAVAGQGVFYYITIGSILLVLALSANTAFADFPRLCRAVAENGFLPRGFAARGRRLVYSQGIWVLAALCAALLILFGGVTDRLIPLFAVGAFLAFTLSQAGMVAHWRRTKGKGARGSMFVNGLGAVATATTVVVVTVSKFVAGAWVTVLLIPALMIVMFSIRRHYREVEAEVATPVPLDLTGLRNPLAVVPILAWNRIAQRGLRFAVNMCTEVLAVHIECEKDTGDIRQSWPRYVEEPARRAGRPAPRLVVLPSPYRFVLSPLLDYVLQLERDNPDRDIVVLIPELVERRWYHYLLHNQRAEWLRALLLSKGCQRIILVNVPWYIRSSPESPPA